MADKPPAQKTSDDDLVRAVDQVCETTGAPAAPTRRVAAVDYIEIQQQQVGNRLEGIESLGEIQVGPGSVWYVDEEGEGGRVDFSELNWENIPAEDIPTEKIEAHPDTETLTEWEESEKSAKDILSMATYTAIIGFAMVFLRVVEVPFLAAEHKSAIVTAGSLAFLVGIGFILIGLSLYILARVGQFVSQRGYDDSYHAYKSRVTDRVRDWIPISVTVGRDREG